MVVSRILSTLSHYIRLSITMATTSTEEKAPWSWSWRPTSDILMKKSELDMLSCLSEPYKHFMVKLPSGEEINTLNIGNGPPLVMIHGFGGGIAVWAANLEYLSKYFTVYVFDLPGFGRSSRPPYSGSTPEEAEAYFIGAMDDWMTELGLQKAVISGHSLGGYLAASWALSHPERFKRLILIDPFGIPKKHEDSEKNIPFAIKLIAKLVSAVSSSPMSLLRASGPFGPRLLNRIRPDLIRKFQQLHPEHPEIVSSYIYHINAKSPASGEVAFTSLVQGFGWAKSPLVDRLGALNTNIPVTFLYGENSWMDPWHGICLKESLQDHQIDLAIIPDAGHHVYIDNYESFNKHFVLAINGELGPAVQDVYPSIVDKYRRRRIEKEKKAAEATTQ